MKTNSNYDTDTYLIPKLRKNLIKQGFAIKNKHRFTIRFRIIITVLIWSKWRDSNILASLGVQSALYRLEPAYLFCTLQRFLAPNHIKQKEQQAKAYCSFWSKWRDSNSRPPVPETGALPPALHLEITHVL